MKWKLGILKIGAMGDVLMTTPFLRQLRRAFPQSTIDYHVGSPSAAVLEGHPAIDRLFTFDPALFYRKKIAGLMKWGAGIAARQYDFFFVLDKHMAYAGMARYAAGPRCVGFARSPLHKSFLNQSIPYRAVRHEIHYYLDLLTFFFEPDYGDVRLELAPPAAAFEAMEKERRLPPEGGFDVWINSGGIYAKGKGESRRVPGDLFQRMLRRHLAKIPVVLLGSALDAEFYEAALSGLNVLNLAGKLSLFESAGVLKAARSVFTSDGGGMHLASSVNDRVHAFFGPTHPLRLRPLNRQASFIWHDQDIYDDAYMLYGTPPRGRFFTREEEIFRDFTAILDS